MVNTNLIRTFSKQNIKHHGKTFVARCCEFHKQIVHDSFIIWKHGKSLECICFCRRIGNLSIMYTVPASMHIIIKV